MKKYDVVLLKEAEDDLLDIHCYISRKDNPDIAEEVFCRLQKTCVTLEELPERGHLPLELDRIAVFNYLEIHSAPFRIIYEVDRHMVFVHCILDGRRELQELLQRRIIRM